MNTEQNEERSTEDSHLPGDMLRQAREKLGYSQKDVASRLRLRQSVVNDIENNHFEEAQLATFTRGYVRSYAKFVGLDENAILAKLDHHGHAQPQEQEMQSFSRRTKREAHDSRIMRLTWVLAVLFIGLTGVWWWQSLQMSPEAELAATVSTGTPPLDESLATAGQTPVVTAETVTDLNPAQEAQLTTTETPAHDAVVTPVSNADEAPKAEFVDSFTEVAPVDATNDAVTPVAEETTEVAEVETPAEPVVPASDLELSFTGDCWIDIRDANGKRLDTGIKKAGDVLKLDGAEPFKVVLGAPGVVTMSYQGKPVDLSRYPAGKVARLKLPQ
ncbi:cytoskeleton protein RodZ [Photobacterium aphoticum]|uniref:XRE family transcriptional regulator n=1 Tax=Photobacterium aphoticum TaxID=754436 RepID=A0A0J1JK24_9GAMM|nr:cytoskeleton protein RodZ [Photobacterium aphoticum]KLV02377.1 XRE family transcriptional regulator [Photobacterium aphoticum]PSU56397.1 cytoskeleton protein RodZ [Photobacterium aphoticum]